MVIDKNLVFCEGQDIDAISGSSSAVDSTDTITVGKADFGYKGMFFVVKADEEIKSASANGNVTIFTTTIKNLASETGGLAKDTVLVKALIRDCAGKKYLKAQFTGDGTWVKSDSQGSTMKVSAFITFDFPNQ